MAGVRRILIASALCLGLLSPAAASADDLSPDARYAFAGGCYSLRHRSSGRLVVKGPDGAYRAAATSLDAAEPFRLQATALGSYLLYGRHGDFLATDADDNVASAPAPSPRADWRVDVDANSFTLSLLAAGNGLAVADDGRLVVGQGAHFGFEPTTGCAVYPEAELNAVGTPFKGASPDAEVRGFVDAHVHLMTFEFLGGNAICGRPWHPYGVAYALPDCAATTGPSGVAAPIQNFLEYGVPVHLSDTKGWPTFNDWPVPDSLAHQQTYYKWLERAWMGGLRLAVNTLTDNTQLCNLFLNRRNGCDEMESIRLQAADSYALQNYIDAQNGGPGKGWFRIVSDPAEARRVINDGKLAVMLAVETSRPLGCRIIVGDPQCDEASIDRDLDALYDLGIRALFPVHKFDNAFGGTTGDPGVLGVIANTGNLAETGHFWPFVPCPDAGDAHDETQISPFTGELESLGDALAPVLPAGVTPLYPEGPLCSTQGLTDLGRYLLERMMAKGMLIEVDHMSVLTRQESLALLQENQYSGVISSHCWSTPDAVQPILALGGFVNTCGGPDWAANEKAQANSGYYCGLGRSTDMGGFAGQQPPPRAGTNLVEYPFTSVDGGVTFERETTGQRVFDFNGDGVAHYGLVPDSIEYSRRNGGEQLVADQFRGAEGYLRTWASAEGAATELAQAASAAPAEPAAFAEPTTRVAPAASDRVLPRTGIDGRTGATIGMALLALALVLRSRRRAPR